MSLALLYPATLTGKKSMHTCQGTYFYYAEKSIS